MSIFEEYGAMKADKITTFLFGCIYTQKNGMLMSPVRKIPLKHL